jgi:hypothetical protein
MLTGDAANADPVCDLSPHHHLGDRSRGAGGAGARRPQGPRGARKSRWCFAAREFVYAVHPRWVLNADS